MISIIICTRNRANLLTECLDSFVRQKSLNNDYEVLLIDNASNDNTQRLFESYLSLYPNFHYFYVPEIGLSHARNCGYQLAKGDWVAYIDDDARVSPNFVERAFWIVENFDFDCFGGTYIAWYPFGKPEWLPNEFGNKEKFAEDIVELKKDFLSGGIMICKKAVLESLGGFSTQVGMKQTIGYGEDDEIQIRMRKSGYKIGFDPGLSMEHAVLPHKFKLQWHFRAAYAKGRDSALIFYQDQSHLIAVLLLIWTVGGSLIKRFPVSIFKLITQRHYFWQNLTLDILLPICYYIGHLRGKITRKA